jgi:hypothetical protein
MSRSSKCLRRASSTPRPDVTRAPQVAEIVEAFVHRRKAPVKGLFQCGKPLIDRCKPLVNADEALVNPLNLALM